MTLSCQFIAARLTVSRLIVSRRIVSRPIIALGLALLLGACASSTPRMADVRAFAAQAPKLGAYHELTERYRNTYQREQAYLTPEADARARLEDQRRQDACDDFVKLQYGVQTYMQALGRLAGDGLYDLEDQVKTMGGGIKAWPDTGLDSRHVNAYAGLTRLLTRAITGPAQERAARELLREADQPVQALLEAMRTLLRLYEKTGDDEQDIVLGVFDVSLPYVDRPGDARDRLLAALAKSERQNKTSEYRLIGLRRTLAQKNLAAIELDHHHLVETLAIPEH